MPSRRAATLLGLLALVFWTTSVAVVRQLVAKVGPFTYLAATSLSAGLLLAVYQGLRRKSWTAFLGPPRKYLLLGGACFLAYFALFATSLRLAARDDVAVQLALVNYLWPAFVLLLSVPLVGHRADWPMLAVGIVLAFAGAAAATTRGASAAALLRNVADHRLAFALMLLAALSWGAYSNLARRYHAEGSASGVPLLLLATGALFLAVRFARGEASQWDASVGPPLVYAAVFPSALAYSLWETGMRAGSIPVLGAASYLLPLSSVLFACWYLNVQATGNLLVGSVLVIAGALLSRRAVREAPRRAAEGPRQPAGQRPAPNGRCR